ncbi:ankyrin repeat-containing domain protein [Rhypophila decipiens]|uniref:Ankyrin repeat-containing domain protein n=1 Tax=Rhypophila decipiens TaxID=261697 RepID=A0AAN7B3M0_9PEZI|nr:ankyrin repeat-containing domain protein [Rhypophila decipiens]
MEVVGAVASFIAIGQALAAVPSIVDILKALPTARMELIVLSNEFETLRATHADVSSLLDMLSDQLKAAEEQDLDATVVIDPALLRRTEAELMALVSDLGQLISSCQSAPSNLGKSTVKRIKWLGSRGKILKLTERARDIRLGLQQAMASLSLRYHIGHTKMLLEIRRAVGPSQDSVPISVQDGQVVPSQISDSLLAVNSPRDIAEEQTLLMARQTLDHKTDDEILEIQTYLSGRCSSGCNCQCHYAQTQSSTPMWLKQNRLRGFDLAALGQEQTEFPSSEINDAILDQDIVGLLDAIERTPASINYLDELGEAAIHQAARTGHGQMIRILIENGADINRLSIDQKSALHLAAEKGHLDCLHLLLELGAAVDQIDLGGFTPTHTACSIDHPDQVEIVKALVGKKPSLVLARDDNGETPLMTLARYQSNSGQETFADTLKVMLDAGADLKAKNMTGHTALDLAALTNSTVAMTALLTAGARIGNVSNCNGNILHLAARSCTFQMIDLFHSCNLETLYGFHMGLQWDRDTPWGIFRWSMGATLPDNYFSRISSRQDAVAFVRLFRKVRDESLQLDIDTLTLVLQHVQERNTELAIKYLEPLIQRKKRLPEMLEQAETFRVVGIQIRQGMWDAAIESVEENIEVFRDEMKMSPWEMLSIHDEWPDAIDYTDVRDYHGTEAEEYPIFEDYN